VKVTNEEEQLKNDNALNVVDSGSDYSEDDINAQKYDHAGLKNLESSKTREPESH
jgi:hypothetical protein